MILAKWDRRFLDLAAHIGDWSKDPSTKVGAVVVGPDREIRSTGYNGPTPGMDDDAPAIWARPRKYLLVEHAERNATYFAALNGVSLRGCTIYVHASPALPPCADCARGIIRAGLSRVVMVVPETIPDRWRDSCDAAREMFTAASVELVEAVILRGECVTCGYRPCLCHQT